MFKNKFSFFFHVSIFFFGKSNSKMFGSKEEKKISHHKIQKILKWLNYGSLYPYMKLFYQVH